MEKAKRVLNRIIRCLVVCCGLFLIAHCRVLAACLTGVDKPESPAWHKKCC